MLEFKKKSLATKTTKNLNWIKYSKSNTLQSIEYLDILEPYPSWACIYTDGFRAEQSEVQPLSSNIALLYCLRQLNFQC